MYKENICSASNGLIMECNMHLQIKMFSLTMGIKSLSYRKGANRLENE